MIVIVKRGRSYRLRGRNSVAQADDSRSSESFAENEQHPGKNDHAGCRDGRLS